MTSEISKGHIKKKEKGSGEYENLHLEGIKLLQKLSSNEWSDYNEHDPGITILENIAYTMTNLSYKTNLPIKNILVESKGGKLESGDNGYFIPSEILTTNPITLNDFRKIFIDKITNVKNVWIKPQIQESENSFQSEHLNNLQGLYHIFIEVYDYASDSIALKEEENRIKREVKELFHENRNLCEDLYEVTIFKPFQLHMKLSLTLNEIVSGEEVFAEIYYQLNDYLTHEVRFSSLWELQEKNEEINSIFNGPLLENGFINDNELNDRLDLIVLSNMMKIIAKVEGVISVDFFELSYENYLDNNALKVITEDSVKIPPNYSPILVFPKENTNLILETDGVQFSPDLAEVQKQLSYIQAMNYGSFKSVSESLNVLDIPEGEALGISSYYPLREQFPLTYGIGHFGLPTGLSNKRYAQANQLKAYLLPFDQLMSNFLAQLTNLYTLYNVKGEGLNSYFYKNLEDMPTLVQLIKTHELEKEDDSLKNWNVILASLNKHYDQHALTRLNDVADSMLARFGEEFPTYSLKKIHINSYGKKVTDLEFEDNLLEWKRRLIANYGQLSYNRTKAYDYTKTPNIINNYAVEGIKNNITPGIIQKTAILMGIKDFSTRSLSKIIANSGIKIYQKKEGLGIISEKLEIVYSKEDIQAVTIDDIIIVDETVENLTDSFYYLGNSGNILTDVLKDGVLLENYQIKETASDKKDVYYVLFNKNGKQSNVLHISETKEKAKQAIDYSVNFLVNLNEKSEGLYLLEHLLLAPPYHENYFGFSLSIPLKDGTLIKFNQANLQSNEERNISVNEINKNLFADKKNENKKRFKIASIDEKFVVTIVDENGQKLAISDKSYTEKQAAKEDRDLIIEQLSSFVPFQFSNDVIYFSHYGENKIDETFFSFQMSIILPSWPVRFQNQNFRTKFDNIIYEQAPIHIAFHSYWIDLYEMVEFEKTYYKWLELIPNNSNAEEQIACAYDLITKIQSYSKN